MSEYPPPRQPSTIYNSLDWTTFDGGSRGGGSSSLNFPTGQGTETLPYGVVWGDGSYQNSGATDICGNSFVSYPTAQGLVNFPNGITINGQSQTSANTGYSTSFTPQNGLPSKVTLNANGAITAISDVDTDLEFVLGRGADANATVITNMGDPVAAQDAATKNYIDTNFAPLASPSLTGIPTAPTAPAGTNTTQIATTAFVEAEAQNYAPLASPALTGTPTAPTAAPGTNTTQIATTAFVEAATTGSITNVDELIIQGTTSDSGIINPMNLGGIISKSGDTHSQGQNWSNSTYAWSKYIAVQITPDASGNAWAPSNVLNDPESCWIRIKGRQWISSGSTQAQEGETSCLIQLFVNRWNVTWFADAGSYNINNKINGNANYNYVDSTYSPYGRQYYTFDQVFSGVAGENAGILGGAYYMYILFASATNQSNWFFTAEVVDSTYVQSLGHGLKLSVQN